MQFENLVSKSYKKRKKKEANTDGRENKDMDVIEKLTRQCSDRRRRSVLYSEENFTERTNTVFNRTYGYKMLQVIKLQCRQVNIG